MTEETTVQQDEPKGEPAIDEVVQENDQQEESPPANDNPEPSKNKDGVPKWAFDTITGLRAGKRDAETKAQLLEQQNQALVAALAAAKTGKTEEKGEPKQETSLSEVEIEKRAIVKAAEIAARDKFDTRCNEVANAGEAEFSDFKDALSTLHAVGVSSDIGFLQTVTELPNAHKLLHHLGNNPDEALRIAKLPPVKMALELAKLEGSVTAPKPKDISKAPAPIKEVKGTGKVDVDLNDPNLDTAKWIEIRRKEKAAKAAQ